MLDNDPRRIPTRVKHEILAEYIDTWGGIIIHGLRSRHKQWADMGKQFVTRFVYVDCFAAEGQYGDSTEEQIALGSPVIGIQALDKLRDWSKRTYQFDIYTNVILAEKDKNKFERLLETLREQGFEERIVINPTLANLENHHIALFNSDYREHLPQIRDFTSQEYTWSLYFLDPYGAKGIDLDSVRSVVTQEHVDAIIYYPYNFIQRRGNTSNLREIRGDKEHKNHLHIQLIDKMYGSEKWSRLVVNERAGGNPAVIMDKLVNLYRQTLQDLEDVIAVKQISLNFEDKDRPLYSLFLTTHDGTGALKMNEILDKANIRQHVYREERQSKIPPTQMKLFSDEQFDDLREDKIQELQVNIASLATDIYEKFRNRRVPYRQLINAYAQSDYYAKHIESSVKTLRRDGRASFDTKNLKNDTQITFR
jgi:three-Cys-motif partner protein